LLAHPLSWHLLSDTFATFMSIFITDMDWQLCFPGRPLPVFVRYVGAVQLSASVSACIM